MRLPHRLQGQKVKSQGHGAGAYCGGHLAAQLVIIIIIIIIIIKNECLSNIIVDRLQGCCCYIRPTLIHLFILTFWTVYDLSFFVLHIHNVVYVTLLVVLVGVATRST